MGGREGEREGALILACNQIQLCIEIAYHFFSLIGQSY